MNENEKIQNTAVDVENTSVPENASEVKEVKNEGVSVPEYAYTSTEPAQTAAAEPPVVENVAAGIVGALLFALVGGLLYFVIYQFGYIAGIAGYIAVICAVKGYSFFAKKESLKGVIISIVAAVVVILVSAYLAIGFSLLRELHKFYPEENITFFDAVNSIPIYMQADPEFTSAMIREFVIALLLCALASFSAIRNAIVSAKANSKK